MWTMSRFWGVRECARSAWDAVRGSAYFKFSTHPGWLCHPLPVPLLPLPACRRCKADWCGQTLRGGTADPGWRRLQAVNLCGNETMCTHTATVCTPSAHNSAYLCREQSAQCLLVAQLDTAVEPSCSSSPRTGQYRTELCGRARGYCCCCCCPACAPHSSHSMIGPAYIATRLFGMFLETTEGC